MIDACDSDNAGPIVNRNEPIPMLNADSVATHLLPANQLPSSSPLSGISSPQAGSPPSSTLSPASQTLQSRIFSSILSQILPETGAAETAGPSKCPSASHPSAQHVDRPNFSLPLMSANFRRFNARIGVVFVFQNRMIRLFTWHTPSHTLSFLAIYTFCCLEPAILVVLPVIGCLFFIIVPSFLTRHPPPPHSEPTDVFQFQGPASAPPRIIKPAPDMSKDFFRNMRDLQNSMEDFSVVHDRLVALIAPVTNFSNERLSSLVFAILFVLACSLFITATKIPWRALFLVGGWGFVCSSHPVTANILAHFAHSALVQSHADVSTHISNLAIKDIVLDEPVEARQVEVFELQKQLDNQEWQSFVYSPSPYDPQSPRRISGELPRGTRFFEDVEPPKGWEWKDKKWTLDPHSKDWVEERLITAVEIETDGRRWVYDISAGDLINSSRATQQVWEEGPGLGPKGEWRRRRWVRQVKRKVHYSRSTSS